MDLSNFRKKYRKRELTVRAGAEAVEERSYNINTTTTTRTTREKKHSNRLEMIVLNTGMAFFDCV
jgi:hypothetical protein